MLLVDKISNEEAQVQYDAALEEIEQRIKVLWNKKELSEEEKIE